MAFKRVFMICLEIGDLGALCPLRYATGRPSSYIQSTVQL